MELLAPNGKPTNLTPEQYRLVRTPAFISWFGDWENSPENSSKVVDENGEPLVVYHGTTFDFNEFKKDKPTIGAYGQGIYFSSSKSFASDYARGDNGRVLSIFLNIRKTFVINNDVMPKGYENYSTEKMLDNKGVSRDFTKNIVGKYDGVKAIDGYGDIEFVVFEPTQIKLADGTNTNFDGSNPDVRYAKGGNILNMSFNHENANIWMNQYSNNYSEFTNFCQFILDNKIYENLYNSIIGNYFKTLSKYSKDNNYETAFIKANEHFLESGGVNPISFLSKYVSKYLTKNVLSVIHNIDSEISLYTMNKVKDFILNSIEYKENGLDWCLNKFGYSIVSTKIKLNDFIKLQLENNISKCEPRFKNQLDKARKLNDSNKFQKLKAIFEEVSDVELQEAIELCDKHNSKITQEFPQITIEKTGVQLNYYTLYKHSEVYDVNSKRNVIVAKYLQNVSIDLLKAVNKLISHYPTTRVNLSTDDYRIKSSTKINSQNNPTITFGKYNGKDILSIWKLDKKYCLWLKGEFEKNKNTSTIQQKIYDIISQLEIEDTNFENGGDISFDNGGENNNYFKDNSSEEISFSNFHLNTIADFSSIYRSEVPSRKPDFISESGSKYWYDGEYVIRQADHWGELGECTWMLDSESYSGLNQGKCLLSDFKKQNIEMKDGGIIINGISIPENIDALLKEKYSLDNDVSFYSDEWNKIIGKRHDMGLVPDEVRKSDEYIRLKTKYKLSLKKLQDFNQSDKNKTILDFTKKLDRVTQQKIRKYYLNEANSQDKMLFGGVIDGNTELFETAMSFKKLGFSDEKIFYETGYFIGLDGKWRSEIDDDSYVFLLTEKQLLEKYENKSTLKLGDLVSHSEFFRILPKSKDILVNLYDLDDYDFTYFKRNPEENCIAEFNYRLDYPTKFNFYKIDLYIDFKYIKEHGEERKKYPNESSIGLCALHEMQHILQNQRGNRRSSTDSERRKQFSEEIERARIQLQDVSNSIGSDVSNDKYDLENYLNYLIVNESSYLHELYYNDPAEVEARAVVQRFINKDKSFPSELNYSPEAMKKGGSINPYAVCTTSIGKTEDTQKRSDWSEEGLDKYERCVLKVKAKMSNGGELKIEKKKVYEGDNALRDMPLDEVEKYIGIYHEQEGNIFFAKNRFLIWFYDTTEFAPKINSGEYDFLMFPNRMKGFSFNSVGIIDEIWTSKWQNKFKGAKNLLGMVQGYYDEANNKIVIHFMSVRPSAKRNHINSFMIQYAKKVFNSNDVVFHEPTEQGQSFIDSNKFEQGGDLKNKIKVQVEYDLLAPNGKPSNLTPEQYKLVRSPDFISWFGNWIEDPENASKVVDSNGEPKECYHGTIKGGFTKFDSKRFPTVGYFAEDYNFSKNFILAKKRYRIDVENEMIYNVFLSIKNPIDLTSIKDGYEDISMEEFIKHLPYEIDSFHDTWKNQIIKNEQPLIAFLANNDIIDSFKRNGYDGVKFHEGTIENRKDYHDDEFEVTSTVSWIAFYPEQIKLSDGTNTTFDSNNPDIRFEDGGGVSFDKVISASSRFRPTETVVFDPPLEGKNGAKLISYTWSYEWTMKPNYEGELVSKRVSDWTQAEISAETGRDIVHQYTILMPSGEYKTVSSDSVPVLLGYLDKKELKSFPNLVTASKTLAKQQMQLAILESQKKEYDDLYAKFEKAEKPEIKEVGEDSKFSAIIESYKKGAYSNYAMGDVTYRQDNDYVYGTESYKKRPISRTTIEQLTWAWISKRVEENGGVNPRGLYDLKNRVARQKRKVENILNSKMENGGTINENIYEHIYYKDYPKEYVDSIISLILSDKVKSDIDRIEALGNMGEFKDAHKLCLDLYKYLSEQSPLENGSWGKEHHNSIDKIRQSTASLGYVFHEGGKFIIEHDRNNKFKLLDEPIVRNWTEYIYDLKSRVNEYSGKNVFDLNELKFESGGVIVGEEMADNKFPTLDEAYDIIETEESNQGGVWIAEEDSDYSEDAKFQDKEQAMLYVKEIYDFIESISDDDFIPVYRCVSAEEVDLDPYSIGESWSIYLDSAKEFGRHLGEPLSKLKIISGYVPKENVDWENAIRLYHLFSDSSSSESEFELPIPSNNKILNVTVSNFKDAKELPEYNENYKNGGEFSDFDKDYYEDAYRDRSEGTVIRQVYDSGILNENERYIFSSEKEIKFREDKQEQNETDKPEGLWYSIGNEWAEEVSNQLDFLANRYNYVHKIKITDKVLSINTIDEAIDFTKKYGVQEHGSYMNRFLIKWVDVAEDYSGIEVKDPASWSRIDDTYVRIEDGNQKNYNLRYLFWWMFSWDVASGCVWREDGIESIELFDWEQEIMDSYGQFENGGYLGSLLYGEIEKKNQQEKANELRSALLKEGFFVNQPNTSITDFGVSTYISFIDEFNVYRKFRISDHPVTNHERISNEYHYSQNTDVNKLVESVKRDIEETRKNNLIRIDLEAKDKERTLLANEKWERIKVDFEGLCFKKNDRIYQDLTKFSENKNRSNIYQKALDNNRYGETPYYYEWTESKNSNEYCSEKPSREFIENYEGNIKMLKGGYLEKEEKDDIYKDWKELINMSYSELKEFYDSEEGKVAGLKKSEADELGIHSGRESARWIMKMKKTKREDWTNEMWAWAKRQIGFVKRMSGAKGDLIDEKGNKTRKYLSLLIWGHNPKKSNNEKKMFGGIIGSKKLNYSGRVFVGKDNNWRFEFSDHKAKLLIDINDILDKKINNVPLIHFIQHRELFKAYPELRDIKVVFKSKEDYFTDNPKMYDFKGEFNIFVFSLAYDKTTDLDKQILIYIDYERANKITSTEMYNMVLRGTITEVQHAIQQAEGFGEERGLSYFVEKEQRKYARVLKEVWGKITSLPEKSIERIQAEADFNIRLKEIRENARLQYENQLLEIESIDSANRIKLNKSQRDSNPSEIEKQ